jgi:hypothetical protein
MAQLTTPEASITRTSHHEFDNLEVRSRENDLTERPTAYVLNAVFGHES